MRNDKNQTIKCEQIICVVADKGKNKWSILRSQYYVFLKTFQKFVDTKSENQN